MSKRLLYILPLSLLGALGLLIAVTRGGVAIGKMTIDRAFLEGRRAPEKPLNLTVIGMAEIAADVSPDLAAQHIGSLRVMGLLRADHPVQTALIGRLNVAGTVSNL